MRILRSLFLILFSCFGLCLSILETLEAKVLADYPNQVTRDGELVVLPDKGTVYVATDFQAQWSNFNRWLTQTRLVERIEAGEDVYGLILGDAVDHKPGDPIFEPYGDVKIVDQIMQLQQQLGEERLIYLRGNHELASADAYAMLKKAGMNADNRQDMIAQLYQTVHGPYFKQFNFLERMTDEHYNYLINLPTVAIGKNGFVGVHAGTSRSAKKLADLVRPSKKVFDELLWGRPAIVLRSGYTPFQTAEFLKRIGGRVLVVGHTTVSAFPKDEVSDGVARHGKHQLIFSTGYGAAPGVRSYLAIDLSKRYNAVTELKYGGEIQPLHP
ncbi:metallophosphoesterase [Candidatus Poribacteria bacterium]|nr:metallophosphoesterase [Candidatus Poribacteria bacterium]